MSSCDIFDLVACRYRALVPKGASVLVAVSGGGDSTALLFMLHELKKRCAIKRIGVLHVNHGLRGSESDGDEKFVASLAQCLQLPFYVKRLKSRSLHSPGMEAWARSERYGFFQKIKAQEGYDHIVTGHTADDQAETVLFRIMRGTGLRGLRGILAKREDGIIRPIIDLRREEILSWLASHDIRFRHDSSNDDCAFGRNRIRHEVLPALERREPGAYGRLLTIAEKAARVWSDAQPAIEKWISTYVRKYANRFVVKKTGLADGFHGSEGLRLLFESYAIPTDSSHVDEIMEHGGRTSGEYLLPGGEWRYYPGRETIVFRKKSSHGSGRFRYALTVPGITECPECGTRFIITEGKVRPEKIPGDNLTVVLDRETCGRRLVFRSWRADDRFVPFGSNRQTGVGSFLAKQKLSKQERINRGVVEGRNNTIVWIPGVRISQQARITPETLGFLKILYQSCPAMT
jgi:tRNA(Ile)-lysidine synthase